MNQAKRIYPGCYVIGSYRVEKVVTDYGIEWNILKYGDWCETLSTLRACKEWIASH